MTTRRLAVTSMIAIAVLAASLIVLLRGDVIPLTTGSTTTLVIRVTHRGVPVGARVLLLDPQREPLRMGKIDLYGARQGRAACRLAAGAIGSWNGIILANGTAEIPVGARDGCDPSPAIPYGSYTVKVWRGIEFEPWGGAIDLRAGRGLVSLDVELTRRWTPHGTLAADLHVHAQASNDSTVPNPQRVIAQAAAGVQVIGLSDHNVNGDLDAEIAELGLTGVIASIASNELTSEQLHVGVYPVTVDRGKPANGGPLPETLIRANAEQLFAIARALPGNPIVQLNHPRFRVTALYDGMRWNGTSWPPPFPVDFDAVEVLAGYTAFNAQGDRRFDDGVRDYYTLVDHGHLVTPLGNSDTHDLNWVLDGTTRTYVFVDDPRTDPFDEAAFITALRGRRVVATSGPWLDVEVATEQGKPTVGPGQHLRPVDGAVWVDLTLAQTSVVRCERIRITIGGARGPELVQTLDVPDERTFRWSGALAVGATDTWIGITADGDQPLPIEMTGSYQQDKWKRPGVTPFAIIGPILVDADGDGRWKRGDADVALTSSRP
jgi:hypothetical protein